MNKKCKIILSITIAFIFLCNTVFAANQIKIKTIKDLTYNVYQGDTFNLPKKG